MPEPSDPIARSAAEALTARFGAGLPQEVEKQILGREAGEAPERYIGVAEGVAIATLILQCAQFAWQIYSETRNKDATKRQLRLQVKIGGPISAGTRDEVVEVVVDHLDGE